VQQLNYDIALETVINVTYHYLTIEPTKLTSLRHPWSPDIQYKTQ